MNLVHKVLEKFSFGPDNGAGGHVLIAKVRRANPLGTMNVGTRFQNPSNREICVWFV